MDSFNVFFKEQLKRHFRHPAIWVVIILTMIGARYFIPLPGEGYVTLSVNNAYPLASSGVIGLQLGIIAALLLTPLAYIYLRSGSTRTQPWQITDIAPSRRLALNLGQGAGDIIALWGILLCIGIAGLILCFFRLPLSAINPFHLFMTLFLVAAPALAFTAGIKRIFDARPWLRGGWGDALFFMIWLAGNIMAMALFQIEDAPLVFDVFGFAASAFVSTSETISMLAVGSTPSGSDTIFLDPVSGFANPEFLWARLFWLMAGASLFALSALVYRPRRIKQKKRRALSGGLLPAFDKMGGLTALPVLGLFGLIHPYFRTVLSQILSPKWAIPFLLAISLAGFVFPFRGIIGPAVLLVMTILIARYSALWEKRHLRQLRSVMPGGVSRQFIQSAIASMLFAAIILLPAMISAAANGRFDVLKMDFGFMVFVMPMVLLAAGYFTRRSTLGLIVMLSVWYGYLNLT